jgi:ligand-binding sensor domain-containing protein
MLVAQNKVYLKIIIFLFGVIITYSCTNKSRVRKETPAAQARNNVRFMNNRAEINAMRLKFTTGVRSILEDSKGNIWFGSDQEGVGLFHKGEFKYFTVENGLSDNQVRNIYEDENGIIWFEGGKGVSSYNGLTITPHKERIYSSKDKWRLNDGDLWFKGDETVGYNELEGHPGVYQYNGQTFSYRTFPVKPKEGEQNYYSVTTPYIKSKNGNLWFGTYGAAIGYNGSDFVIIDNDYLGLNDETGLLHIRSIMEDSKGNLWIGNNGIGVFKYNGAKTIHFTRQQKLKKQDTNGNSLERIFAIGEDTLENIWFGTVESGVWRYDGKSLTNFTKEDGLESEHIWTIYKSKQGELWFGGANPCGVYVFNGRSFERKY